MPPDPNTMKTARRWLGTWLRATREARGLSQDDVAGAAGLTKAQVSDAENGKTNYTIATFLSMAKAVGVDLLKTLKNKDLISKR